MKIAVVTDSTADIPDDIAEQYHIHVVSNLLIIDGKSYEDRKGISRQEFYQQLPGMKELPTTAPPPHTRALPAFIPKARSRFFHPCPV
jgi:fatty acid-binding protein DegV